MSRSDGWQVRQRMKSAWQWICGWWWAATFLSGDSLKLEHLCWRLRWLQLRNHSRVQIITKEKPRLLKSLRDHFWPVGVRKNKKRYMSRWEDGWRRSEMKIKLLTVRCRVQICRRAIRCLLAMCRSSHSDHFAALSFIFLSSDQVDGVLLRKVNKAWIGNNNVFWGNNQNQQSVRLTCNRFLSPEANLHSCPPFSFLLPLFLPPPMLPLLLPCLAPKPCLKLLLLFTWAAFLSL